MRRAAEPPARIRAKLALSVALLWGAMAAQAVDLLVVYRLAVQNDPQYASAGAAHRTAQERVPQARARLLPHLSLSASADGNHEKTRKAGAFGGAATTRFSGATVSIGLSQPIYRRELLMGLGQADARVRQSDAEFAFALQELMVRVSERYFDGLRAVDELEFRRSERDANERQLGQSRQRFEVGLVAVTDVEEAKAGFDLASARVIEAEAEVDNAREALREVTGVYLEPGVLKRLVAETPMAAPEPGDVDEWTGIALERNLELRAAWLASEVARTEIRRQEARHLPTLELVASHELTQSGGRFGDTDIVTTSIGLRLELPIYEGGEVLSRTRESRHRYRGALDDLERRRRITQRRARDAFRGVRSGISRVEALGQAVASAEAALGAVEAGFEAGARTSVDVLNGQRDLFGAKRDFSHARYDYVLERLRLEQAAGVLDEADLAEVNGWLE